MNNLSDWWRAWAILPAGLMASATWAGEGCPLCAAAAGSAEAAGAVVLAAATQPASVEDRDAQAPRVVVKDAELDALLDRVDAAAQALKTLSADLIYDTEEGLLGDEQRRVGKLVYATDEADDASRMAVALRLRVIDGVGRAIDERYVFDGDRWVEIDGDRKRWTGYAPAAGANDHPVTAMLPSRFDKGDLLAKYVVERRAVEGEAADPTPTIRLRPRSGASADFDHADVTFDEDATPIEIVMIDGAKTTTIRLKNVDRNGAVDESLLDASEPAEPGWAIEDRASE